MLPAIVGYGWNQTAHRYYDLDTGVFVSKTVIRDSLENLMDLSALKMDALSEKLQAGTISLADWQSGMMQQIKAAHVASSALANGGWAQMTQSDWGYVGSLIKEQYQYLRNFSQQIANGTQPLDGRFMVRTDLYGDAANGTYSQMIRRSMVSEGYDEGRRVLEAGADHCDDCLEYANDGWMPIDEVPEIGDSQCQVRCRCEIVYRKSTEAGSETE